MLFQTDWPFLLNNRYRIVTGTFFKMMFFRQKQISEAWDILFSFKDNTEAAF